MSGVRAEMAGDFLESLMNGLHRLFQSGRSCGQAYLARASKKIDRHFLSRFDMKHPQPRSFSGADKLQGVVAILSTDHDDRVAALDEFRDRALTVLRWLTDGVDKAHLTLRKRTSHRRDNSLHPLDRLGGLRDDSKPLPI